MTSEDLADWDGMSAFSSNQEQDELYHRVENEETDFRDQFQDNVPLGGGCVEEKWVKTRPSSKIWAFVEEMAWV